MLKSSALIPMNGTLFGNRLFIDVIRRRQWHPTPVLLPGKSHGWRILVGCSAWGCEESDLTQRLHFHFSLSCIGEGNGNPLQCSCLENPGDGGAWWAAVHGVARSWTRLKWLSNVTTTTGAYYSFGVISFQCEGHLLTILIWQVDSSNSLNLWLSGDLFHFPFYFTALLR